MRGHKMKTNTIYINYFCLARLDSLLILMSVCPSILLLSMSVVRLSVRPSIHLLSVCLSFCLLTHLFGLALFLSLHNLSCIFIYPFEAHA